MEDGVHVSRPVDPLALAVGKRVSFLRENRDYTASQLAKLAQMDVNYLWRIEAGRQNLSLRNVARLAQALDVTLANFFDGIDVRDAELGRRPYAKRASEKLPGSRSGSD